MEGGRLYRLVFRGSSKDYAGTLDLGKENSLMNLFRVVYKEHGGRGMGTSPVMPLSSPADIS